MFFVLTSTSLFTHSFIPSFIHSSTPNQHGSGRALVPGSGSEENALKQRARAWPGTILPTMPLLEWELRV